MFKGKKAKEIKTQLEATLKQNAELQHTLKALQTKSHADQQRITALEAQRKAPPPATNTDTPSSDMSAQLAKAKLEVEELTDEIDDKDAQIDALRQENQFLINSPRKGAPAASGTNDAQLRKELAQRDAKCKDLQATVAEQSSKIQALQVRVDELQDGGAAASPGVANTSNDFGQLQNNLHERERDVEVHITHNIELQAKIAELEDELENREATITEMRKSSTFNSELPADSESAANAAADAAATKQELAKLKKQTSQQVQDLNSRDANIHDLECTITTLTNTIRSLQQNGSAPGTSAPGVPATSGPSPGEFAALKASLAASQDKVSKLQGTVKELTQIVQQQMEENDASSSGSDSDSDSDKEEEEKKVAATPNPPKENKEAKDAAPALQATIDKLEKEIKERDVKIEELGSHMAKLTAIVEQQSKELREPTSASSSSDSDDDEGARGPGGLKGIKEDAREEANAELASVRRQLKTQAQTFAQQRAELEAAHEEELAELQAAVEEYESEVDKYGADMDQTTATIQELRQLVESKNAEVASLRKDKAFLENAISEKHDRLSELQEEIKIYDDSVIEKTEEADALREELAKLSKGSSDVEDLRTMNRELEAAVASRDQSVADLQEQAESATRKLTQVQKAKDAADQGREAAHKRVEALTAELKASKKKGKKSPPRPRGGGGGKGADDAKVKELEAAMARLEEEKHELNDANEGYLMTIASLRTALDDKAHAAETDVEKVTEEATAALRAKLESSQASVAALENTIADLKKASEAVQDQGNDAAAWQEEKKNLVKQFQDELKEREAREDALKAEAAALEKTVDTQDNHVAELTERVRVLDLHNAGKQDQLNKLHEGIRVRDRAINTLQQSITATGNGNVDKIAANERVALLENELDALRLTSSGFEEQVKELRAANASVVAERDALAAQVKATPAAAAAPTSANATALEAEVAKRDQEIASLRAELKQWLSDVTDLSEQVESQETQINELMQTNEGLKTSQAAIEKEREELKEYNEQLEKELEAEADRVSELEAVAAQGVAAAPAAAAAAEAVASAKQAEAEEAHEAAIAELEEMVAEQEASMEEHVSTISMLRQQLVQAANSGKASATAAASQARIVTDQLSAEVEMLRKSRDDAVDEAEAAASRFNSQIEDLGRAVEAKEFEVADLSLRLESMTRQMNEAELAAAEAAVAAEDAAKQELKDRVAELEAEDRARKEDAANRERALQAEVKEAREQRASAEAALVRLRDRGLRGDESPSAQSGTAYGYGTTNGTQSNDTAEDDESFISRRLDESRHVDLAMHKLLKERDVRIVSLEQTINALQTNLRLRLSGAEEERKQKSAADDAEEEEDAAEEKKQTDSTSDRIHALQSDLRDISAQFINFKKGASDRIARLKAENAMLMSSSGTDASSLLQARAAELERVVTTQKQAMASLQANKDTLSALNAMQDARIVGMASQMDTHLGTIKSMRADLLLKIRQLESENVFLHETVASLQEQMQQQQQQYVPRQSSFVSRPPDSASGQLRVGPRDRYHTPATQERWRIERR